jgi:hypothetical protein
MYTCTICGCGKCIVTNGTVFCANTDCNAIIINLNEEKDMSYNPSKCSKCGSDMCVSKEGLAYCSNECCSLPIIKKSIDVKDGNPKDSIGTRKVPVSVIPCQVMGEVGLALLEGARKYGRHNYRVAGVRASVYYDAVVGRHLASFWEGEDIDEESGLSHVTKAIAGLIVLRDSMLIGNWVDDRPPKIKSGWVQELNRKAGEIIDKYPDAKEPYTELNTNEKNI